MKRINLFILLTFAANTCGANIFITRIVNNTSSYICIASESPLKAEIIYSNDQNFQDHLTKPMLATVNNFSWPVLPSKHLLYSISLLGNGYSANLSGIIIPYSESYGLGLSNSLILARGVSSNMRPFALIRENKNYIEKKNLFNNPASVISRISDEKTIDGASYTLEIAERSDLPPVRVLQHGDHLPIAEGRYQITLKINNEKE